MVNLNNSILNYCLHVITYIVTIMHGFLQLFWVQCNIVVSISIKPVLILYLVCMYDCMDVLLVT